jgi:hypothetical protein
VTLPKDIPAAAFWSFTLYDNQTRSMLLRLYSPRESFFTKECGRPKSHWCVRRAK